MKVINYIKILTPFLLLFLISCEEEDLNYSESDFITFTNTGIEVSERNDTLQVTLEKGTFDLSKAVDITLSVTGIMANDSSSADDFYAIFGASSVNGNTVTVSIPAGEASASFFIEYFDNLLADGRKLIQLEMTAISDPSFSIGFPGEDAIQSTLLIQIADDDCPLDITAFASADYVVEEEGYDSNPINSPVSLDANQQNVLNVENLGDWNTKLEANGLTVQDAFLEFNPDLTNPTITIQNTPVGLSIAAGSLSWSGTGTYSSCDNSFRVEYVWVLPDGTPTNFTGVVTFSPN